MLVKERPALCLPRSYGFNPEVYIGKSKRGDRTVSNPVVYLRACFVLAEEGYCKDIPPDCTVSTRESEQLALSPLKEKLALCLLQIVRSQHGGLQGCLLCVCKRGSYGFNPGISRR